MNIRIQNLGAIKEACIDLNKKLTVFCGPNNTGKTYVSYIIYALTNGRISEPQFMPDEQLKMFINDGKFNLNIDLDELCLFREKQLSLIKSNLDNIFGISEEKIKSYFGQFDISYLTTKEEFKDKIIAEGFTLQLIINELIIKVTKKPNEQIALIENLSEKKNINTDNVKFLSFQLLSTIYNCLAFYPNSTSVIFPVERNSIYTFNKELSIQRNNLVDQMQDLSSNKKLNPWDLLFKRTTRYPLAVRDGLEVADDLVNLQNHKSSYFEFADELENELLKGKVSVSKDGEVQFASDKAKTTKIPIHLTASIVKTLASLTFYLRYLAQNNDLIIIDEPELNLHPDSQIILARIFARLLNNGFRLLISTHSDYIIRELNNLIMLSSASPAIKAKAEEFGYKKDEYIIFNDVNAYLFNYKARGKVTVKSIPVSDTGFEVETIDNAIHSLNNISEELYYAMKYGEE
jgi:predicted ATPase